MSSDLKSRFIFWSSGERGLQTKSGRIMWLGLAFLGTRLFIQRKKKGDR